MKLFLKTTALLYTFFFLFSNLFCQISGVVNQYTTVTSIDYANSLVQVSDPSIFTINDRVLLIQMQGATIVETDNASFGNISPASNLNGVGDYEMATVCDVTGNDVSFSYDMVNNDYMVNGLQLVKVYSGVNETVSGTVTAQPWNGSTGGVIAIELSGTLTLNADIDASEQGFRGGGRFQSGFNLCFFFTSSDYYYPFNGGSPRGGKKGEGIATYINNKEYGRGKQANGGGGGNDHNAGGGGGGNYGLGGIGGDYLSGSCSGNYPGLGGLALNSFGYSGPNNRVFMGGGGGAGQDNNNVSVDGGAGGGIILIKADQIEGNGNTIASNGETPSDAPGDGGAGGGGGGTILFSTNGFGSTALTVEVTGGGGGTTSTSSACAGPGGGGSGGVIWTATALSLSGLVSSDVSGGSAGISIDCGGATQGAMGGEVGWELTGYSIPEDIINVSSCVLSSPIELFAEKFSEEQIQLSWPALEANIKSIVIEKMIDDQFEEMDRLKNIEKQWIDQRPLSGNNIYRLRFLWENGSITESNLAEVYWNYVLPINLSIFPNPSSKTKDSYVSYSLNEAGYIDIEIMNALGKTIVKRRFYGEQGQNKSKLDFSRLSQGTYFLRFIYQGGTQTQPLIIGD